MVVEHTFITTMEAPQAMAAASAFLQRCGFQAPPQTTFEMGQDGWRTLEVRRGVTKLANAKSLRDLPQLVRLEWDRGRVDLAASMSPKRPGKSAAPPGVAAGGDVGHKTKPNVAIGNVLMTLVWCLELLLAHQQPDRAAAEWDRLDAQLADRARREKRRKWVLVALILGLLVVFAAFSFWANPL